MTEIPQREARRLQFAAITGGGQEPASSLLELRYRAPGVPMRQCFIPCRELIEASATTALLAEGFDVYVNTAPVTYRFGGADAIKRKWVLAVDLDRPDALERLAGVRPQPSIVINTGTSGHAHAWWPLHRPLQPSHAVVATRRLAHHLGADMAATDAARVLRLAGTQSFKHQPPSPVECVRLELDSYTAADVVGHLPNPPNPRPASHPTGVITPAARDAADPLMAIPASEYLPALTGRELGADGKLRCPVHSGGRERTPSLHAYSDPEKGWWCFGCERGGSIIDLGALLYAIEPRGRGFHEIRRRLAAQLLPHLRDAT